MTFAIVGVLAFQGLWLRDSYKTRKEAFRQSVNDALQMAIEDEKAVKTIRNMSTVIWQDNKPDTAFHIEEHFIYAPGDTTKDVTVISSPSIAYFSSDSLLDMSVSVNADSMLAMGKKISATISQEINDNEFLSSTDYSIDFDVDELYDFQEDMEALGFEMSDLGNNSFAIQGIPSELQNVDAVALVRSMIDKNMETGSNIQEQMHEKLALSMANFTAIPAGKSLTEEEMLRMVDQLFACQSPNHTPDGKSIITVISDDEMENKLK